MDHIATYNAHLTQPYGNAYARVVGRFQEGFLADRVCSDLQDAFDRAVEATERLIPVIRLKNA